MSVAEDLLRKHGSAVDAYLVEVMKRQSEAPPRLVEAMNYSLTAGGKRLRPALVLECYSACAGKDEGKPDSSFTVPPSSSYRSALSAAGAIELIHTFSLVHDDLPAMDDDDLRRGRPTNHKVFGEAMAILAGDAMVTLAFEIIATDADPKLAPAIARELARASGPVGMIGGQVLDIDGENQSLSLDQLRGVHRMKTGALLTCSCRMGAIAAGASEQMLASITAFGRHLGLAFQIVDDLLDVTATPEQMGKATHKDAGCGKNTYPGLLGIEGSRIAARQQVESALDALKALDTRADGLRETARFVEARTH